MTQIERKLIFKYQTPSFQMLTRIVHKNAEYVIRDKLSKLNALLSYIKQSIKLNNWLLKNENYLNHLLLSSIYSILWNQFYSWWSMFVGSQNGPGSWGRNSVDRIIRIISINIKQMIVYSFVGM